MYGLLGLLPTSGENFMSTASLEIYLMRKIVMFNTYFTRCISNMILVECSILARTKMKILSSFPQCCE